MKAFVLSFAVALILLVAPPGLRADEPAQPAEPATLAAGEPPDEPELEFVVTADRVLTEARRTPSHVTIISGDEIRRSGQTRLVDVMEAVPGVQSASYEDPARAQIGMRGFGHQRVLVLVDGRRLNDPDMGGLRWMQIPVDRIDRIEVVRGGGSSLYGNNAVAGVINIITRQPERLLELTSGLTVGSFGLNQQRLGFAFRREGLRFGAGVERYSSDGYRDRSANEILQASFEAGWGRPGGFSLRLQAEFSDHSYELPGPLTEEQFEDDPTQVQALYQDDEGTDQVVSLRLDNSVPFGELGHLDLDLGYRARSRETDFVGFAAFSDEHLQQVSVSPSYTHWLELAGRSVRLKGGLDGELASVETENYNDLERTDKDSELSLLQLAGGAYLAASVEWGERLDLTPQVRYDHAYLAAEGYDEYDDSTDYGALSGALGFNYRPVDGVTVFARGARLFRYPATDEVAQNPAGGIDPDEDAFATGLKPETGWEATVGAGYSLASVFDLQMSGYVLQMQDEIGFEITNPPFQGTNRNLDATRRIGGDLELRSRPIDQLRLAGGYSYVHATFVDGENEGNQIPLVPNHQLDGSVTLVFPAGFEIEPAARFRSEAYQGGDDANELDKLDAYTVADLRLRWVPRFVGGDLSIFGEVKNMFDESYAPYAFSDNYYPAPGRSYQAGLSYAY